MLSLTFRHLMKNTPRNSFLLGNHLNKRNLACDGGLPVEVEMGIYAFTTITGMITIGTIRSSFKSEKKTWRQGVALCGFIFGGASIYLFKDSFDTSDDVVYPGWFFNIKTRIAGIKLIKVLNHDLTHHNYVYQPEKLNVDTLPFSAIGSCAPSGLYFGPQEYAKKYAQMIEDPNPLYYAPVKVPWYTYVHAEFSYTTFKFKAHEIILGAQKELQRDSNGYLYVPN